MMSTGSKNSERRDSVDNIGLQRSVPFGHFLDDLALLGGLPSREAGSEFGVISARSNERYWLIPLKPKSSALAGLALFQPVSPSATVAKAAATLAIRAGLTRIWLRNRIRLNCTTIKGDWFNQPVSDVAFFTGTEGPHRKTAIEFISKDGQILGYAKLSREPHIAQFIRNEASTLRQLAFLGLTKTLVPKCLDFSDSGTHAMLVTDSLKTGGSVSPTQMGEEHREFLVEIAEKTRRKADKDLRNDLISRLRYAAVGSKSDWQARFQLGIDILQDPTNTVLVALSHGDFTPWNCFLAGDRLYVFDWEYADPNLPLGYDTMKFFSATQASGAPTPACNAFVSENAKLLFEGDGNMARVHGLLALLLHSAFYIKRARVQGGHMTDWREHAQFSQLIDVLQGIKGSEQV
ncbi:phosphotransferase [Kordiimonas sp.]|uniref:phosphotransferase n=1 Tax=Kordiimonas sp. TaxID=1970157 RepID=UPI003A8E402D